MLATHWPVLGQTTENNHIIFDNIWIVWLIMFKPYLYSLLIPGEIWKQQNVCTVGLPLRTPRDRVTETQWEFQSSIRLRYRNIDNDKKLKCLTDLDSSYLNQASKR